MTANLTAETMRAIVDAAPVVVKPLAWLKDYPKNNKTHTEESVRKLAASIERHGQMDPILTDGGGVIIAGHGRRAALALLSRADAQVRVLKVTESQARELRLASNLTTNQKYNTSAISDELHALVADGFDLSVLGDSLGIDQRLRDLIVPDMTGAWDVDTDSVVDDISRSVRELENESDDMMGAVDGMERPSHEAFGFRKLTTAQVRVIRAFMAQVAAEMRIEDPAAALTAWISETMS